MERTVTVTFLVILFIVETQNYVLNLEQLKRSFVTSEFKVDHQKENKLPNAKDNEKNDLKSCFLTSDKSSFENHISTFFVKQSDSNNWLEKLEKNWRNVSPLYFELHRFLRRLFEKTHKNFDFSETLIPAELIGITEVYNWMNYINLTVPYTAIDIDYKLSNQNELNKPFNLINDYYESLGFSNINEHFNFTKGELETQLHCENILNKVNISYCNNIKYELANKESRKLTNNWTLFETVDDLISILALNPYHVREISGTDKEENSDAEHINFLMEIGLQKIVFLSYGMTCITWYKYFLENPTKIDKFTEKWWNISEKIMKIKKPLNSSGDLDLCHISFTISKITKYFVVTILEFQIYKKLCTIENDEETESVNFQYCDLYSSFEAGEILKKIINTEASDNWFEVVLNLIDSSELSSSDLIDFFQPLYVHLKEKNGPLTENELTHLLYEEYEEQMNFLYNKQAISEWDLSMDLNNLTKEKLQLKAVLDAAEVEEHYRTYYFQDMVDVDIENETLKRQIDFLTTMGSSPITSNTLDRVMLTIIKYVETLYQGTSLFQLTNLTNQMTNIYNTAKVCPYLRQNCCLENEGMSLEPDLENIMAYSKNEKELLYYWNNWRISTGVKIKDIYVEYVNVSNEAARENGYSDMAEMWVSDFESDNLFDEIENLWNAVKPLYYQLHQYVHRKLKNYYRNSSFFDDDLIPAHLLGNMWGQTWINIKHIVKPFPEKLEVNVTQFLLEQNYTVLKMFETANNFYESLGLDSASISYDTNRTIIEKPANKTIECHGSAWDFFDKKDYRIKMCTRINFEDFLTIHHEMGHIHYYMLYKNQPITLRNGANPGFHEAIGDVITLSVITPSHLEKIGLMKKREDSFESSINNLMDIALEKVAFLPFGYLIDKWRWDVFKGRIPLEKWNSHWWFYRNTIQKVKSPLTRKDNYHFDPGAKFHIPNDYQYISYFVAHILQFQIYRGLCLLAGKYHPNDASSSLHECDFYNSMEVGKKLRDSLSLGTSKHWKEVLREMINETDYDSSALMEYFAPLHKFLIQENAKEKIDSEFLKNRTCSLKCNLLIMLVLSLFVHF